MTIVTTGGRAVGEGGGIGMIATAAAAGAGAGVGAEAGAGGGAVTGTGKMLESDGSSVAYQIGIGIEIEIEIEIEIRIEIGSCSYDRASSENRDSMDCNNKQCVVAEALIILVIVVIAMSGPLTVRSNIPDIQGNSISSSSVDSGNSNSSGSRS